jgi:hypothetical protein
MKYMRLLLIAVLFIGYHSLYAQLSLNFETPETSASFSAEGASSIVENPDKTGINTSNKVGYYNKIAGNWHYVSMEFTDSVAIGYNNTLTFKLRTSVQGRIFAKFWIGNDTLIESWAPDYHFQPLPNTWTECKMDMTRAMGKHFTKLELAACVDNEAVADVYFDDVLLSNPDVSDGTPKAVFTVSSNKVFIGDEITFDAFSSFDFDGELVDYSWNFGDNTTASGKIVTHTFNADSIYNVVLTLTDNDGKTASEHKYIFVLNENEKLGKLSFVNNEPETNEKIEAIFQVNESYTNVYNPDEVSIDAEIQFPDGKKAILPCFY